MSSNAVLSRDEVRDEIQTVRGVRVHLLSGGAGEPVLYLHGAGATNRWLPFHQRVADQAQIFAPDLLGFGETERPDWLDNIQDFVVHYLDLLDALGIERVHLVGLSFGGWIAAELAIWSSHRLKSLSLVDAAGLYLPGYEIPDIFTMSYEQQVRLYFEDQALADKVLAVATSPEADSQRLKGQVTLARVSWNPYLYSPKLMQRLHRIQVPTQILWGERDRLLPLVMAEAWQAGIAGSELRVIPNCGHNPPIEQPDACAEAVATFVDRHAG